MITVNDFNGKVKPDWCPACGNFSQLTAIKGALTELQIEPKNTVIVSGIGCSSNLPEFIRAYGFHGLHGRVLPVASGMRWNGSMARRTAVRIPGKYPTATGWKSGRSWGLTTAG
ncbi:MAG: hypothetical protein M1149_00190 [Candidatus Thermoplasmatota archaeon]|nr:hypothetical protein [Candidatus Thermoplasmatota archaeon]